MTLFLMHFLTGERCRAYRASTLLGAAGTLLSIFMPMIASLLEAHSSAVAGCVVFALASLVAAFAGVIHLRSDALVFGSMAAERDAAARCDDELSRLRVRIADTVLGKLEKKRKLTAAIFFTAAALDIVGAVLARLVAAPVWTTVAGLAAVLIVVLAVLSDSMAENARYKRVRELAGADVDALLEATGMSAQAVKKSAVQGVLMTSRFLLDPEARAEYERQRKRSAIIFIAGAAVFAALLVTAIMLEDILDEATYTWLLAGTLSCGAVGIGVLVFVLERKFLPIFEKNATVLSLKGDADRMAMQKEYLRFRRASLLTFVISAVIGITVGIILGALGVVEDPEFSATGNFAMMTLAGFVISVLIALAVWVCIVVRHLLRMQKFTDVIDAKEMEETETEDQ